MKRAFKILVVGFYALVALAAIFFAMPQTGWKALSVQTGSMTPAIPKGSLVIIHSQPLSAIAVGQVVTYREPSRPSVTITHRVVAKSVKNGITMFTTKGDANKAADPQIPGGSIVGAVQYHAAGLGKVVNWLHTPLGIIVLVGLPGLLIIISEFQLMIWRLQEYAREEAEVKTRRLAAHRRSAGPVAAPLGPTGGATRRQAARLRTPIVRVALAAILLPALALGVKGTLSQLTSSVAITNNRLGIAATSTTGGGTSTCPSDSSSGSISNTGPGSTNGITSTSTCTISNSNSTSVTVTNTSSQTTTSGSVRNNGNTNGNGGVASGATSNSSSSTTTVNTSSSP